MNLYEEWTSLDILLNSRINLAIAQLILFFCDTKCRLQWWQYKDKKNTEYCLDTFAFNIITFRHLHCFSFQLVGVWWNTHWQHLNIWHQDVLASPTVQVLGQKNTWLCCIETLLHWFFFFLLRHQGIQITATTPTASAVRLETEAIDLEVSNRVQMASEASHHVGMCRQSSLCTL